MIDEGGRSFAYLVPVLISIGTIAIFVFSFAHAARRGLYGWAILMFLLPGVLILYWIIRPTGRTGGPRPA